jgi:hypothetical protein
MARYKDELKKDADELYDSFHLSKAYRRKKLIIWFVRTILTIIIYIIFWKYTWIRWTLILYIPLSLFNLFGLLGWNFLLKKKISRIKEKIDGVDE